MTNPAVLADLDPATITDDAVRSGIAEWSDEQLAETAAAVLSAPRQGPANSFVLHAPLELMARRSLLTRVRPDAREDARLRIAWLAAEYAHADAPSAPVADRSFADDADAASALVHAIGAGELDDAEAAARWLGRNADAATIAARLTDPVLPLLSAAGHACIFLFLLPRVAAHSPSSATMLGATAREVARFGDWRLNWIDEPLPAATGDAPASLLDALLDVPGGERPEVPFIFPIMHIVDSNGMAQKVADSAITAATDPRLALRDIQRAAALSMLQDTWDFAPYGWSHALTMSQAAAALAPMSADPTRCLRIASTYVTGFRSAHSDRVVSTVWTPTSPEPVTGIDPGRFDSRTQLGGFGDAIAAGPHAAAAYVARHPSEDADGDIVTELATRAAIHPDAHLAKYTLACFDAAAIDPSFRMTYLAAAAYLTAWWAMFPVENDPIVR